MKKTIILKIDGLNCSSCVMHIDGELEEQEGIYSIQTHFAKQQATILFDPEKITNEEIFALISALGYTAELL